MTTRQEILLRLACTPPEKDTKSTTNKKKFY